ncbi:PIN domain-containing protein [Corynebacterium rhinophilum]|uniref:PIN domain-containing protein n=1 Tax=Corynebacterium rhinophilum TaxID=3050197 RepID=UPI00254EBE61|nr:MULTISPECIES: PIN domain-containing protein [unclassified Corynebacterium]MDK8452679.1 PIN domain-containing protein [Corynebacterium sp. MSK084]MDK8514538.1 PIN domain-containing protein [Corynebacterium sp. MSK123]MDK8547866.1 PIN domain-containing protein [Corynebacterium sp. MSK222]MDK8647725.1 PIN domain-containing protein [Corynebacterium sp. MSK082]MDK8698329.1 PIN domain-containing protein [Corynebacterium sp. MSK192]
MSGFTVVYDANVLYPSTLRDILVRLAGSGYFRARWTDKILDEVFRNLKSNRPDLDPTKLARTRTLMCRAVDDCLVTGYEDLVESLSLPDRDDRHVLAAAIRCGAQVIVTENKRDFPKTALMPFDIEAQSADEFLCNQIDLYAPRVHQAITYATAALKNPPRTINDVLNSLAKAGAPEAAELLRR